MFLHTKTQTTDGWNSFNFHFTTKPELNINMKPQVFETPLDCKEIQPVHPKGDQSWVFIGRTDVDAEAPVLWPPDVKS